MASRADVYLLYLHGILMSNLTKASRRISYLLRHAPVEEFKLDKDGWALCADVRTELNITADQLKEIVESDEKDDTRSLYGEHTSAQYKDIQLHRSIATIRARFHRLRCITEHQLTTWNRSWQPD